MNTAKRKHGFLAGFLAISLALVMGAGVPAVSASAQELGEGGKLESNTLSELRQENEADTQMEGTEEGNSDITISLKSSIETPATPSGLGDTSDQDEAADNTLNGAQGLSLSTASEVEVQSDGAQAGSSTATLSAGAWIVVLTVSLTLSGLILLGAAAGLVYYFRRNWNRWGGEDDDEY